MKRLLSISLLIFTLCRIASAQDNARIQALGGSNIVPDISRAIYINPAFMNNYKNTIQASFDSPIIGVVGLNDVISIGGVFNRGLILNSFYANAIAQTPNIGATQTIPHILFGIDLKQITLGLDLFWETSNYTSETVTPAPIVTTDVTQSINNPGAVLGANLKLGDANVAANFGIGFPNLLNKTEITPGGTNNYRSNKGLYLRAGAEVTLPLLASNWTFGTNWSQENYQFENNANVNQNEYDINYFQPYVGFTKDIVDKIFCVLQYKAGYTFSKTNYIVPAGYYVSTYALAHTLLTGFEKQFQSVWIFDSVATRGGGSWTVTNSGSKTLTNTGGTTTTIGNVTAMGNALPYLGLGASKGHFTLDVAINPAAWNNGLLAGPDVARVTGTFKF